MSLSLRQRALNVLASAYRGIHHVDLKKAKEDSFSYSVCVYGGASTYDSDVLTRLVIAAHDACVRLDINGAANGYLRLIFTDRERGTDVFTRHPRIDEAIRTTRKHYEEHWPYMGEE
jgi:hypothetical protein